MSSEPTKMDIATHFELARADYLGRKRMYLVIFWVGFVAFVGVAVWHSGFSIVEVIKGLPRTSDFIRPSDGIIFGRI